MTKKIKYILIAVIGLTFTSCDKYLTLEPQDGIVREDFWKTKEQVAAAVNGCYASLLVPSRGSASSTTYTPGLVESLFLWGELRGDMVEPGTTASVNDFNIVNVNIEDTNPYSNWAALYSTINNCNTVLDFAPGVLKTDNTFKETELRGYLGEALALRSLMYFYLVRTFKEVPLVIKSTASDEDNLQIPKSSEAEILDQIIKDLKTAEEYCVTTYGNRDNDKGRITKFAVQALLADVYLWKEDYTNCVTYCQKIIDSRQFALIPGDSWFTTVFYQGGSNESIFEFYFNTNRANPFYAMFAEVASRYRASARVSEEVYTIDEDNLENKDIRGDGAAVKFTDGRIYKYHGVNSGTTRPGNASSSIAHWIVYRYADILLMQAEALNQLGDGEGALEIIAEIRERANALPATNHSIVDFNDKDAIARYILQERGRELAFEGKRWFDILRTAKRNNYADLGLLIEVAILTVSPESQQSAVSKLQDVNSHYLPINFNELQTNKKLQQNPFYVRK